jgi:RNA polymerase sigma-70 factor (sigma-E family)
MDDRDAFLVSQHAPLVRAAFLLTGQQASAEDLAQETLVRAMVKWRLVRRADEPAAYLRTIMLNVFLADRRRRWTGELSAAVLPDRPGDDPYVAPDDRDALRRALMRLPTRQRAAVVLRHYEQRSEAQTADLLGCSIGTVKSLTSRGLATLRRRGEPATGAGYDAVRDDSVGLVSLHQLLDVERDKEDRT